MTDQEYKELLDKLGKADWIFDHDFCGDETMVELHMPCCSQLIDKNNKLVHCGNGPLTGDQILTGNCGEHE